jgi:hypothetical protein
MNSKLVAVGNLQDVRIVSLVPLPASMDSRTLKIAMAFERAGAKSSIFENRSTGEDFQIHGVPVSSLRPTGPFVDRQSTDETQSFENSDGFIAKLKIAVRAIAHFLKFVLLYFLIKPISGLLSLPRAQIYYVHEYRLFPTAKLASMLRGGRVVYDAHDLYDVITPTEKLSSLEQALVASLGRWLHSKALRQASLVVTTSPGMANVLRPSAHDLMVVRNIHDHALDEATSHDVRSVFQIPEDQLICVVVGHRKAGQVLENALAGLANVDREIHLVFVGRGYENLIGYKNKALTVHVVGAVLPTQIVPFIRTANVSLMLYVGWSANYNVTLPNGLFQSIAAGLPVLYPDLPEISKLSSSFSGQMIDPHSASSIQEGIAEVISGKLCFDEGNKLDWDDESGPLIAKIKSLVDQ